MDSDEEIVSEASVDSQDEEEDDEPSVADEESGEVSEGDGNNIDIDVDGENAEENAEADVRENKPKLKLEKSPLKQFKKTVEKTIEKPHTKKFKYSQEDLDRMSFQPTPIFDEERGRLLYVMRRFTADNFTIQANVPDRLLIFKHTQLPFDASELSEGLKEPSKNFERVLSGAQSSAGAHETVHKVQVPENYILTENPPVNFTKRLAIVVLPRVGYGIREVASSTSQRI